MNNNKSKSGRAGISIDWDLELPNMLKLSYEGWLPKDIAKVYGVSRQLISKMFLNRGIKTQDITKELKQKRLDKIDKLYLAQYKKYKAKVYRCTQDKIQFDLAFEEIYWPVNCPVLGMPLDYYSKNGPNVATFDRIDPKLPYVKGNVNIISFRANTIKSDGTVEDLEKVINYLKMAAKYALTTSC